MTNAGRGSMSLLLCLIVGMLCGCSLIVEGLAPDDGADAATTDAGVSDATPSDTGQDVDGMVADDAAELLGPGQACSSASECESSECVDGVCCDTSCDGTCQACTTELTGEDDGSCSPITMDGADPRDTCAGTGCRADAPGTCYTEDGDSCDSHAECRSGSCVAGQTCALCAPGEMGYETCWQHPYPQGNHLHDVVVIGAGRFVAVGDYGTVLWAERGDQTTWNLDLLDGRPDLKAVCAYGDVVVAAGAKNGEPALFRFDEQWEELSVPPLGDADEPGFLDAHCLADGTVFLAGGNSVAVLEGDAVEAFSLELAGAEALSVWATADNSVWVGTSMGLEHFNGTRVDARTTPLTNVVDLFAREESGSLYVYAVNQDINATIYRALIGVSFNVWYEPTMHTMGSPCTARSGGIWGPPTGTAIFFAYESGCFGRPPHLDRIDGGDVTSMLPERRDEDRFVLDDRYFGMWGAGGSIVAVGNAGAIAAGQLGSNEPFESLNLAPTFASTETVVGGTEDTVVGATSGARYTSTVGHVVAIDDSEIVSDVRRSSLPTRYRFADLFSAGPAAGRIVGARNSETSGEGVIERKASSALDFELEAVNAAPGLRAMWGLDETSLVVAGNGIYMSDSTTGWTLQDSTSGLLSVYGDADNPDDVVAVGEGGVIVRSGTPWSPVTSPVSETLLGVWGHSGRWYAVTGDDMIRTTETEWLRVGITPTFGFVPTALDGMPTEDADVHHLFVAGPDGQLSLIRASSAAVENMGALEAAMSYDISSLHAVGEVLWIGATAPGTQILRAHPER